jgi:hypothetical protein
MTNVALSHSDRSVFNSCALGDRRVRNVLSAILFVAAFATLAHAADVKPEFADRIKGYRESVGWNTNWLNDQLNTAQQCGVFARGDLPGLQAFAKTLIDEWESAAKALEANDEAKANDLAGKARDMEAQRDIWGQRMAARFQQFNQAPSETWFDNATNWIKPEFAGEFAEYKKKASDANGAIADALVIGVDPQKIAQLRIAAKVAEDEAQVAEMKMYWANDDASLLRDPTITSPELTKTQAALAEWRKQREAAFRTLQATQRQIDLLESQRGALQDARYRAYYQAYDAKQRAGK